MVHPGAVDYFEFHPMVIFAIDQQAKFQAIVIKEKVKSSKISTPKSSLLRRCSLARINGAKKAACRLL